jgi:hypothetical protein
VNGIEARQGQARQKPAAEVGLVTVLVLVSAAEADRADAVLDRAPRSPRGREMRNLVSPADEGGTEPGQEPLGPAPHLWPTEGVGQGDPHGEEA